MAKPKRMAKPITVRFTRDEEEKLRSGVGRHGYATASALILEAVWKELGTRQAVGNDAEKHARAHDRYASHDRFPGASC